MDAERIFLDPRPVAYI